MSELKARVALLVKKGKEKSKDGDYEAALKIIRKAFKIHPNRKLEKRSQRLEVMVLLRSTLSMEV